MSFALGELAVRFGCELRGAPELRVARVATLAGAGPGDLAFLANAHYRPQLAATRATVVVIDAAGAALSPVATLVSANPYATYARIAALLHPEAAYPAGVHPSAIVDPSARLAATASIGADGLRARRSAQSTLRPSAASHNRLVRTTQLGLSRG